MPRNLRWSCYCYHNSFPYFLRQGRRFQFINCSTDAKKNFKTSERGDTQRSFRWGISDYGLYPWMRWESQVVCSQPGDKITITT